MGGRKNFLDKAAVSTDLLCEPMPFQSLVEIVGQRRVIIEKHCGVLGYSTNEICVKTRSGTIVVKGNELELVKMTKEQLVIIGVIEYVQLYKGGK